MKPFGFWSHFRKQSLAHESFFERLIAWFAAVICVFFGMFGVGHILLQRKVTGVTSLVVFGASLLYLVHRYRNPSRNS